MRSPTCASTALPTVPDVAAQHRDTSGVPTVMSNSARRQITPRARTTSATCATRPRDGIAAWSVNGMPPKVARSNGRQRFASVKQRALITGQPAKPMLMTRAYERVSVGTGTATRFATEPPGELDVIEDDVSNSDENRRVPRDGMPRNASSARAVPNGPIQGLARWQPDTRLRPQKR